MLNSNNSLYLNYLQLERDLRQKFSSVDRLIDSKKGWAVYIFI